ncbi:pilus assembly protein TadG-related protein [Agromyces seonyuensis]|nr:pilus assembly protein TadG-related protein [Agromyces seonyuensis]
MLRAAAALRRGRDEETGSTLPLMLGYGVLALVLVLIVVAVTSLQLERKRLLTLADGAALAAAESFEASDLVVGVDGAGSPALDDTAVRAAAADYLADADHGLHAVRIVVADSPDGASARIRLSAVWHAPFTNGWIPVSAHLEVETEARSILH